MLARSVDIKWYTTLVCLDSVVADFFKGWVKIITCMFQNVKRVF